MNAAHLQPVLPLDTAHLHLMVNHLPLFGVLLGLLVGLYGAWRREESIVRVALMLFVLAGLGAVAAYFTGHGAEEMVEALGRSHDAIEAHEEAGNLAVYLTIALAVLSLVMLVRRRPIAPAWRTALFVVAVVTFGVVGYAANLGGRISHPEITNTVQREAGRALIPEADEVGDVEH
ncbi:hypothetical protein [Rhodothermus bifroesti]|uniref:hypothetical protein n=1 Tax=Rhodothermus bifroesti TaxID=2823335 RepID=UPI000CACAA5B|nr:hypothetical protein [Rhodothermus bifroesti]GBD02295.1 hypothetical protein HRbin18_02032 [bacterium HR18]